MSIKKLLLMAGMVILITVLTACGSNNNKANTNKQNTNTNDKITVTDLDGNKVTFNQRPKRIVPVSMGDLDIITALGGEVAGRPAITGNVPDELKDVPTIGNAHEINMEKIASVNPDVVIAHPQLNAKDIPALKQMGVKVLLTGSESIDDIKQSIQMFGKLLQKEEKADQFIKQIDEKLTSLETKQEDKLRSLVIFGVPGNWMAALPNSLSSSMLAAAGGYNIAKDYEALEQFPQYAQIDMEKVIKADPDAVFLITPMSTDKAEASFQKQMAKNPAWKSVSAVKNNHIVTLPNDLFGSNPGMKVIDSLDYLHNEIKKVETE